MSRRPVFLACVLCLLAGFAARAPAAESAADDADRAAPSSPVPVPVSEILARADRDETFAAGVIRRATSTDPSALLLEQLGEIAATVDEKHLAQTRQQLRRLSIMRLESLSRHWSFDVRRHADWQQELRLAYASTTDDAAEVASRMAEWEATRQMESTADLPAAMRGRIQPVIDALERAEEALSPRLATQISLGRRGNALRERIQEGRDEVTAAIAYLDRRLLRTDVPPLWSRQPDERSSRALDSLTQGIRIEARFAADYARFDRFNRASRAFALLLLPLLLWMSWRSRKSSEFAMTHSASWYALQRPWSAWLLLVIVLVLAFETDAPMLVRQLAMLVALVPVIRQLTPEFRARYTPWPGVVTGMYLLAVLGFLLASNAQLLRLYTLGVAVSGAVLVTNLLLRARASNPHPAERHVRVLRAAGWTSVGLFAVSAISNLIGNTSLAEMLVAATIYSAYLALALYAGLELIVALLQTFLSGKVIPRFARAHSRHAEHLLIRLLHVGVAVGWLLFTLESFRVLRPVYHGAKEFLGLTFSIGKLSISLGAIGVFAASVVIAYWAARVVRLVLQDEVLSRMPLPRGVSNSIASLTYYALLMVGWMAGLSAAGLRLDQMALLLGALGVGIGFGLQNVVNNFVSGLILMFERPLQPGDIVEVGDAAGRVRDIGMRATTIHTFEGADVVVPNGAILSANLKNWTLTDRSRRIQVNVGVGYGSNPGKVIEVLNGAANATIGLSRSPAPVAQFSGFGASSLDFVVMAWTSEYDTWGGLRSELATRIHAALTEAGIEIPFPQQDLHLRSVSEQASAMLARTSGGETKDAGS